MQSDLHPVSNPPAASHARLAPPEGCYSEVADQSAAT